MASHKVVVLSVKNPGLAWVEITWDNVFPSVRAFIPGYYAHGTSVDGEPVVYIFKERR